uniref:Uncharacterized protein n=1 Tax=Cacopsylla melanoneura TaxID=428564 RepID=A0A8D8Z7Y7_9HEMI
MYNGYRYIVIFVCFLLRYAIETYGYTSEENIKPIKTTQKRIIKSTIYPFTSKRDRKEKMTEYQILSFPNLYKFIVITKHYLDTYRNIQINIYNTRNTYYITPTIRNNYGKSMLAFQVPDLLNRLPNELKNIENKNKIKTEIKKHFLEENQI